MFHPPAHKSKGPQAAYQIAFDYRYWQTVEDMLKDEEPELYERILKELNESSWEWDEAGKPGSES